MATIETISQGLNAGSAGVAAARLFSNIFTVAWGVLASGAALASGLAAKEQSRS